MSNVGGAGLRSEPIDQLERARAKMVKQLDEAESEWVVANARAAELDDLIYHLHDELKAIDERIRDL